MSGITRAPSEARLCQPEADSGPGSCGPAPGTAFCVGEGNDVGGTYTGREWAAMRKREGIEPRHPLEIVGADLLSYREGYIKGAQGQGAGEPTGV